jgi:prepilin-type N-terminal cleavage/methylation domain-containing protein
MAPARSNSSNARGFSLIEVVISMGILTAAALGVAQLFAVSTTANRVARNGTSAMALAEQKLEQIRSLTWGFDENAQQGNNLPVTDTTTNLAVYPHRADGAGLNPSPSNALDENVTGYFEFLDANGAWVGTGTDRPATTAFVRRWAITPLPTNPNNTIVIRVLVTPLANELSRTEGAAGPRRRMAGDAFLTTVKTRKSL